MVDVYKNRKTEKMAVTRLVLWKDFSFSFWSDSAWRHIAMKRRCLMKQSAIRRKEPLPSTCSFLLRYSYKHVFLFLVFFFCVPTISLGSLYLTRQEKLRNSFLVYDEWCAARSPWRRLPIRKSAANLLSGILQGFVLIPSDDNREFPTNKKGSAQLSLVWIHRQPVIVTVKRMYI